MCQALAALSWGRSGHLYCDQEYFLMAEAIVLEGAISVLAALAAQVRPIDKIYLRRDKPLASFKLIERAATQAGVAVERVDPAVIDAHTSGRTHGGIVALAGLRRYLALDELGRGVSNPFIILLDGIEDPFNLGQAIRALYAAGAQGLVMRPRYWRNAEGIIVRASAGASEWMPTAVAGDISTAVNHFAARGLKIVCTVAEGKGALLYEADLRQPLLLVVGGEHRGITRMVLRQADLCLRIPYGAGFERTLGAASAVAVLAFEILRQRRYGSPNELVGSAPGSKE
jgi:23S rRNA (guanosine2251-2'-O)-methyltransferase